MQAVRVQASADSFFFFSVAVVSFCFLFFGVFLYNFCLFVCFSFITTAHPYYI